MFATYQPLFVVQPVSGAFFRAVQVYEQMNGFTSSTSRQVKRFSLFYGIATADISGMFHSNLIACCTAIYDPQDADSPIKWNHSSNAHQALGLSYQVILGWLTPGQWSAGGKAGEGRFLNNDFND